MKRAERHRLKDNDLAVFAASARQIVEERRSQFLTLFVVLVVIVVAAAGYFGWRGHIQTRAHSLLADAVAVEDAQVGPPPNPDAPESGLRFPNARAKDQAALTKFKVVADDYPGTDAGLFARYREGTMRMALDTPAQAATAFQDVIDRAGDTNLYGQMARLGLAEAQARTGQFDQAISTYKQLSERKDGPLPTDGILMQLGRTYLDAGKRSDAQQVFNRLLQEYPDSPFSLEAKQELDGLKKTS